MDRPWKELPADFKSKLLYGTGADEVEFWFTHAGTPRKTRKTFEGVLPNLERLYAESESEFTRNRLKAYLTLAPCDECGGKRLRPELLAVTLPESPGASGALKEEPAVPPGTSAPIRIPGLNIAAFCARTIAGADEFLGTLQLTALQQQIAGDLVREIRKRLQFLRRSDSITSRSTANRARSPAAKHSASAWPRRSEQA